MSDDVLIGIVGAGSAFVGALLGTFVQPYVQNQIDKRNERATLLRENHLKQFEELYKPLFDDLYQLPDKPPDFYFSEWEESDFREWLLRANQMVFPKSHLLTEDARKMFLGWPELLMSGNPDDIEGEVRSFYKHIKLRYDYLIKSLFPEK